MRFWSGGTRARRVDECRSVGAPMETTTRQLPRPASVALPDPQVPARPRWPAPLLSGLAEVLAQLAEFSLSPLIVLPLFFAFSGGEGVTIGRAVAIVLAAGSLGAAL